MKKQFSRLIPVMLAGSLLISSCASEANLIGSWKLKDLQFLSPANPQVPEASREQMKKFVVNAFRIQFREDHSIQIKLEDTGYTGSWELLKNPMRLMYKTEQFGETESKIITFKKELLVIETNDPNNGLTRYVMVPNR